LANDTVPFLTWMWNSLKLAAATTVLGVLMTARAADGFSRFRGRRSLLQTLLLIQVFPNFLNMAALLILLHQRGQYVLGLAKPGQWPDLRLGQGIAPPVGCRV